MPWYTYVELDLLSIHVTVMNSGRTVDPQRSSLQNILSQIPHTGQCVQIPIFLRSSFVTKQKVVFVIGESFVVEPSYHPLFITAAWTLGAYIRFLPSGWHVLQFSFKKHC